MASNQIQDVYCYHCRSDTTATLIASIEVYGYSIIVSVEAFCDKCGNRVNIPADYRITTEDPRCE